MCAVKISDEKSVQINPFKLKGKGLKVFILNVCTFYRRLDEIRNHIVSSNVDIIGFSESGLNNNISDSEVETDGYKVHRCDRKERTGGGLTVYVRDSLSVTRCHLVEDDKIESVWLELSNVNSKPTFIGFIYRPPDSLSCWYDHFECYLEAVIQKSDHIIILGDFNVNLLKTKKHVLFDLCATYGLSQIVNMPTRVTETSITLIDHIYVSNESNVSEKIVSKFNISDHYPTGLTWKLGCLRNSNHTDNHHIIRYRKLPDYDVICNFIYDNMEAVTNIQDLDSKVLNFNNVVNLALDRVAPLKIKRVKRTCQPPWFNDKI